MEAYYKLLTEDGETIQSAASISHNASYLDVALKAGETWSFQPAVGQSRSFVYPYIGQGGNDLIDINGQGLALEQVGLLIESNDKVVIQALQDCRFVVALTEPWPHPVIQQLGKELSQRLIKEKEQEAI